jgi:hypothetical protein
MLVTAEMHQPTLPIRLVPFGKVSGLNVPMTITSAASIGVPSAALPPHNGAYRTTTGNAHVEHGCNFLHINGLQR